LITEDASLAVVVATYTNGPVQQTLYLSYKGNNPFLIVTLGNIITDEIDNNPSVEKMINLTINEAKAWLTRRVPEKINEFIEMLEQNTNSVNSQQIPVRLGNLLRIKVDSVSEEFNITANKVICNVVARYIDDYRLALREFHKTTTPQRRPKTKD
jgi:hypothetical protein